MPLRLVEASDDNASVLAQLTQFYLHDISEFSGAEPEQSGLFNESGLGDSDDTRRTFLIYLRSVPAGFLSYERCTRANEAFQGCRLRHMFIIRGYRRLGIGEEIARMLFELHHGPWEAVVAESNEPGTHFVRQVVRRYTFKNYRELNSADGKHRVFEFQSKASENF